MQSLRHGIRQVRTMNAKTSKGFKSVAHRQAMWINEPHTARAISSKYGAKVGGGFTQAQLKRRRAAAGRGEKYQAED
jgi:hypothetical protein